MTVATKRFEANKSDDAILGQPVKGSVDRFIDSVYKYFFNPYVIARREEVTI